MFNVIVFFMMLTMDEVVIGHYDRIAYLNDPPANKIIFCNSQILF